PAEVPCCLPSGPCSRTAGIPSSAPHHKARPSRIGKNSPPGQLRADEAAKARCVEPGTHAAVARRRARAIDPAYQAALAGPPVHLRGPADPGRPLRRRLLRLKLQPMRTAVLDDPDVQLLYRSP